MTLIRYMNCRLQTVAFQTNQLGPSMARDAEAGAIQYVWTVFRWIHLAFKVLIALFFVPRVLFYDYPLIALKLREAPTPVLDILNAEHKADMDARQKKCAQKVGMQQRKSGGHITL